MKEKIHIDNKEDLKFAFELYYKPLVVFATRFIASSEDGEDLVQEVYVQLWKSRPSFDNAKVLRSFLYTAVKNKCFNHLKHQKVKSEFVENQIGAIQDLDYVRELEHKLDETHTLHRAISVLSERKKEVIGHMIAGMRNQEIAERMGIQLQTVKTLKSQAYQELRKVLSGNGR